MWSFKMNQEKHFLHIVTFFTWPQNRGDLLIEEFLRQTLLLYCFSRCDLCTQKMPRLTLALITSLLVNGKMLVS